jgi:hypothetical protein
MWNTTEELARIRRQELLAEASVERLAKAARTEQRGTVDGPSGPLREKERRVSETVAR